jgi:membrane fusion protein (multidrug efflux system)
MLTAFTLKKTPTLTKPGTGKRSTATIKVKLEQAQAAQVGASAGINVNQSQIYTTASNSASARQVWYQQARLDKVKKDYNRYANLVKDGSITQQQFDQAKSDLEVAQANLRASQDQYKSAVRNKLVLHAAS